MKLQKLAYYVQSWHLVRHGRPAFADPIEAWADGPVVRRLFDRHRGRRNLSAWSWGDAGRLSATVADTVAWVARRLAV